MFMFDWVIVSSPCFNGFLEILYFYEANQVTISWWYWIFSLILFSYFLWNSFLNFLQWNKIALYIGCIFSLLWFSLYFFLLGALYFSYLESHPLYSTSSPSSISSLIRIHFYISGKVFDLNFKIFFSFCLVPLLKVDYSVVNYGPIDHYE